MLYSYVLDTHTLIWFLYEGTRLGKRAKQVLLQEDARLVIPTIVLVEIQILSYQGRIKLDFHELLKKLEMMENVEIYPLDMEVMKHVPPMLETHDGIIVGTAIVLRDIHFNETALLTKDAKITESGLIDVLW